MARSCAGDRTSKKRKAECGWRFLARALLALELIPEIEEANRELRAKEQSFKGEKDE